MFITVLRTLAPVLPPSISYRLATGLASLAPRIPVKPEDRQVLENAERFSFGAGPSRLAWRWGRGPIVVFAHGWGGRAAQMVKLADAVARSGFQVVVFDGQGHGESPGRRIGFHRLIADLEALDDALDEDSSAWVCHSASGLCLAASSIGVGPRSSRLVFIATPRGPYIPVNELKRHLNLPSQALERCRAFYARQFNRSWDELDRCEAFKDCDGASLLLIQDRDDTRVDQGDAERIAAACSRAEVVHRSGFGHLKLLWSREVADEVVRFLRT